MKKIFFIFSLILLVFISGCAASPSEDYAGGKTSDFESSIEGETGEIGGYEVTTTSEGLSTYTTDDGTKITYGSSGTDSILKSEYTDGSSVVTTYGDTTITVTTTTKEGEVKTTIYDAPPAGQLTVSEWSDIENYEYFLSLFSYGQNQEEGIFSPFYDERYFQALNMVKVNVGNNTEPLQGVLVEYLDSESNLIYRAVTNVNGEAYLFPKTDELGPGRIKCSYLDSVSSTPFDYESDEDHELSITIDKDSTKSELIEIMFVIDATGSMRDELEFLQSEIDDVISKVYEEIPTADIRLALLFYKDTEDDYLTKYFDFSSDISGQMLKMNAQTASGGGDFPEAVDVAMDEAVNAQWSSSNSTKLLFHVLDAPPHTNIDEDMVRYTNAIEVASEKGIRVIPIASSGVDKETEYLLRHSALYTGGTYLYLTNDSGIGGEHIEATTEEEVVVEYLNLCLIRIIKEYYTGEDIEPIPYNPQQ